jgi:tetratricopeptide (TPR) repeat protein
MKKIITIVFLLILLQPVIFAEEKERTDHLEKGKAHFKSGFYQLTPKHRQGEAEQQYAQAVREFKQAIAANPDNEAAYRQLARVYAVQKKPAEAAAAYQKVIELNPSDIDTYVLASLALVESHQYDHAVKTLQAAKGYTEDKEALLKIDAYIEKIRVHRNSKGVSNVK